MKNQAPVFIVGMQRSGTTFLRLLLNRLPQLYIPFESDFLAVTKQYLEVDMSLSNNKKSFIKDLLAEPLTAKGNLTFDDYSALNEYSSIDEVLNCFYTTNANKENKARWGIKTPGYQTELHHLLRVFPDAKIIAVVRDPRGIYLSHKGVEWGTKDPIKLAYNWNQSIMSVSMIELLFPSAIKIIRYEDLIAKTEAMSADLCTFIDIPFDADILSFGDLTNDMPKQSIKWHGSSVKKPDPGKIYSWKTELDIGVQSIFQHICCDPLKQFDYDARPINVGTFNKIKQKLQVMKLY